MSGQLDFSGTLACGPVEASEDVPTGSTLIPYQTSPSPKSLACTTGDMSSNISSPSTFVALPGIGGAGVQRATFLYLRTGDTMQVRITQYGVGSPSVETIAGLKVIEPDPDAYITLVEVQGSGSIEWFAGGDQ